MWYVRSKLINDRGNPTGREFQEVYTGITGKQTELLQYSTDMARTFEYEISLDHIKKNILVSSNSWGRVGKLIRYEIWQQAIRKSLFQSYEILLDCKEHEYDEFSRFSLFGSYKHSNSIYLSIP